MDQHRLTTTSTRQSGQGLTNSTFTSSIDDPTSQLHWHYAEQSNRTFQANARSFVVVIVAISLLLLLALVCLYARWACRYRRLVVTVGSGSSGHVVIGVGGLDREVIDGIPVVLHVMEEGDEEVQCSICLCGLEEGEKVKVFPGCEHEFHAECVDEWLRSRPSCPLCRAVVGAPASVGRVEVLVV